MNEFDKQKFLDQIKDVFQKKNKNQKDKQAIREFFRSYSEWDFWEKITKNSDKLLDILAEKFTLIEYEQDSPIQVSQTQQEKCLIILIQGSVEIKYEANNPFYLKDLEKSSEKEQCNPDDSLENSEKDQKQKQTRANRKNRKDSLQAGRQEIKNEIGELLYEKGYKFQHYSSDDLKYVDVNMMYQNRKKVNQRTFSNNFKTLRQNVINEDDEFYFQAPQFFNSFGQGETYLQQPNIISLSTSCKSGFILNKYLFEIRDVDYDDLSYYALTDVSLLRLDVEGLQRFLLERSSYLLKFDTFLEDFFQSENIILNEQDVEKIKDQYVLQETIKQGDKIIYNRQQQDIYKFYLIKEGFFELQVQQNKKRHIQVQNQYNFVGNQINQKQFITVQNKKEVIDYQTVALLQKGETFGEEIVFSTKNQYKYTVTKKTPYSEVLEFKFSNKKHIPQALYEYIQQQYNKKQQLLIDSDQEEDCDQEGVITSKYNNQDVNKQGQKKIYLQRQKHPNQNKNYIKLNQRSLINSNEQEYSKQLDIQSAVKKVVINEQLLEKLNQSNSSKNKSMFENQSSTISDQKIRPSTSKINQRIRFKSSEDEKQETQSITDLQPETNRYSPIPLVIQNCRKNQFVKKAMKLEQSTLQQKAKLKEYAEKLQMVNYFPPIHAVYKKIDFEFSKSCDKNNFNTEVKNENPIFQQTEIPNQSQVKTIKLKIEQTQDNCIDIDENSQSSCSLKERYHSNQFIPSKYIQRSNSAQKIKREIKINKLFDKGSGSYEKQKLDTQPNQFEMSEQNLESLKNEHYRNLILNNVSYQREQNFNQENQSPSTSRIINYGLKGSKIRRTSPNDKQKRDESLKKSLLIKFMFQIEHDKWLREQEIKNQMLNQVDSNNPQKQKQNASDQKDQRNILNLKSQSSPQRNFQQMNFAKNNSSLKITSNQFIKRPHSASKFLGETQKFQSQNLNTLIGTKIVNDNSFLLKNQEKSKTANSFYSHQNQQTKISNTNSNQKNIQQKQRSLDREISNSKTTEVKQKNSNIFLKDTKNIKSTSPRINNTSSINKNQTFQKQKKYFQNNIDAKNLFQNKDSKDKLQTVLYTNRLLAKQKIKSSENQRINQSSLSKDKNTKDTLQFQKLNSSSIKPQQNQTQKIKINQNNFKRNQSEQSLNKKQEDNNQKRQLQKILAQKQGKSGLDQIDLKQHKSSKKLTADQTALENSDKIKKEKNVINEKQQFEKGEKYEQKQNELQENQVQKVQKEVKITNEQVKSIKQIKDDKQDKSKQREPKDKEKSNDQSSNKGHADVQQNKKNENLSKSQKTNKKETQDSSQNNKIKNVQKIEEMKNIYQNGSSQQKKQKQNPQEKEKAIQYQNENSKSRDDLDEAKAQKLTSQKNLNKSQNKNNQTKKLSSSQMSYQSEDDSENHKEKLKNQKTKNSIKIVISKVNDEQIKQDTEQHLKDSNSIDNKLKAQENDISGTNLNSRQSKIKERKSQESAINNEKSSNKSKEVKKKQNEQQNENTEKQILSERDFSVKKIVRKNKFKLDN